MRFRTFFWCLLAIWLYYCGVPTKILKPFSIGLSFLIFYGCSSYSLEGSDLLSRLYHLTTFIFSFHG